MAQTPPTTLLGRARAASLSIVNATPQLGMWQATGTAIAQAPNLTELREPESGGANIKFDAHGHSKRVAKQEQDGELTLIKTKSRIEETQAAVSYKGTATPSRHPHRDRHAARIRSLREKHRSEAKEKWGPTIMHALGAFWKFFLTPSGFLITVYFLNIVVCHQTSSSLKPTMKANCSSGMGCNALLLTPQSCSSNEPSKRRR